jgi:hypothetical protein
MITLLIDADSMLYTACYKKKENKDDDGFNKDFEEVKDKFYEKFYEILNTIDNLGVQISEYKVFLQGTNNFRKYVHPTYKISRFLKPKPTLLDDLSKCIAKELNAFISHGVETDDTVAATWRYLCETKGVDSVIIASCDKDFKQFPAWIFDYYNTRMELKKISEEEARYNLYHQMITGDRGDDVKFLHGVGDVEAIKRLANVVSEQRMFMASYRLFVEKLGVSRARHVWFLSKILLTLQTEGVDIPYEFDAV